MTEIGIAGDAVAVLTGLVVLALLLFILASWLGRWPLWLAGYAVAILVLAGAFFFLAPTRTEETYVEEGELVYQGDHMELIGTTVIARHRTPRAP